MLAAICAAPSVFGDLGILNGKEAVCYPGFEERLTGATIGEGTVAVTDHVITRRGMGTAIDFAAALIARLQDEKKAEEGVRLYREYYARKGIFENKVYPGIPHLLQACKAQGKKVILATSKPQVYAKQILEHFELVEYFDDIQGSSMDGSKVRKEDVIQSALLDNEITDMQEVLMIGDRKHDVIGSGKFGISCVGVLYGYGGREELTACGAKWIVDTVEDLERFLLFLQ